jgi:hypothetical protein
MSAELIVQRPRPDTDVEVCAFEGEFVRVAGFEPTDYLRRGEAVMLAGALLAAVNELPLPD